MPVIEDYNGFLALDLGWSTDSDKPVERRVLFVTKILAEHWPGLVGKLANSKGNNRYDVLAGGMWKMIDFTGAEMVTEERPVKKRRAGENKTYGKYDWEWLNGKWVRKLL